MCTLKNVFRPNAKIHNRLTEKNEFYLKFWLNFPSRKWDLLNQSINFLHQKPLSQSDWSDWTGEFSDWTGGELGWTSAPDSWSIELDDSGSLSALVTGEAGRDLVGVGLDLGLGWRFLVFLTDFFSGLACRFRFLADNFFRTGESSLRMK